MSRPQIEWKKLKKATFHSGKRGPNVKLSSSGCVASREAGARNVELAAMDGYGVVFTSEPVPVGCMFNVTVLERDECFNGGLGIFFSTENPQSSDLTGSSMAAALDSPGQQKLVGVFSDKVFYGGRPILPTRSKLARSTQSLTAGDSVGIRLVRTNTQGSSVVLEVYFNKELLRSVPLPANGYPLSKPLYGVVDVYGNSTKVKADVYEAPEPVSPQTRGSIHKARALSFEDAKRNAVSQAALTHSRALNPKASSFDETSTNPAESELARLRQLVKQLTDNQEANQVQISQLQGKLNETGRQLNVAEERLQQEQAARQKEAQQLKTELNEARNQLGQRQLTNRDSVTTRQPESSQTYQQLKREKRNYGMKTISGQDVWLLYY